MGAYDIDAAAAGGIISETEALLQPNETVAAEVQDFVGTIEAALGGSPALASFSHYAREMLLPDIDALATRSANAILATRRALSEYAAGDYEMVATAQQAAASLGILTPPPGAGPAVPVSPAEPLPESAPAAHIPAPVVPLHPMPVPIPENGNAEPDAVRVPPARNLLLTVPDIEPEKTPGDKMRFAENLLLHLDNIRPRYEPGERLPFARSLILYIDKWGNQWAPGFPDPPVYRTLPGIIELDPPQVGIPIPETGNPEPKAGSNPPPMADNWLLRIPEDELRDLKDRRFPDPPIATPLPDFRPAPDVGFPEDPPVYRTLPGIFEPPVGIPIPETGNPERGITPQPEIVPGPGVGTLIPGEPTPGQGPDARGLPVLPHPDLPVTLPPIGGATPGPAPVVNGEIPVAELFSRADEVPTESAPSPAPRGRWGLT